MGLFVFFCLVFHSHPAYRLPFLSLEIALPLSCVSDAFYLLCANAGQPCLPSIFMASTRPLTLDHYSATDGETLSPAQTHHHSYFRAIL